MEDPVLSRRQPERRQVLRPPLTQGMPDPDDQVTHLFLRAHLRHGRRHLADVVLRHGASGDTRTTVRFLMLQLEGA